MASQFHNRLIGTVILVSIGVIFLPDLLTGKHVNKDAESVASVPLRPDAAPANAPVPAMTTPSAAVVAAAASGAVSSAMPDGVVVDRKGDQWAVQEVGATVTAGSQSQEPGQSATVTAATSEPAAVKPAAAPRKETAAVATTKTVKPAEAVAPVTAKSETRSEKSSELAEASAAKPAKLQAGQIKSFADVVSEEQGGSARSATAVQSKTVVPQPKPLVAESKPVTSSSTGSAWIIQAGVFSSGANAQALVSKLRAGGLSANLSTVHSGGSTLYRVSVGPDVSRARMESLVPRVSQIAGVSAKVIAYNPLG